LEDHRAATVVTAIDYAKAFNRLCYQSCLQALAAKGASTQVIGLVATFLTNRYMQLKVGNAWSTPLPVAGGVPQGSLIGVFLFNVTTDDLENGEDVHDSDPLAEGTEAEERGEQPPEPISPEHSVSASTPVPNREAQQENFGTPSAKDMQILRAVRGEGGAFTFVGNSKTLNMRKAAARRLAFSAEQTDVPEVPATKGGTWK
jgi:hypothetical protein